MKSQAKFNDPWVFLDLFDEPEKNFMFVSVCGPMQWRQSQMRSIHFIRAVRKCQQLTYHYFEHNPKKIKLEYDPKIEIGINLQRWNVLRIGYTIVKHENCFNMRVNGAKQICFYEIR